MSQLQMSLLDKDTNTGVLPLCYYGHPALKKKSKDVTEITSDITALSKQMIRTMRAKEGIGLAAPQIGRNINLMVLDIPSDDRDNGKLAFTSPGEMGLLPGMPLALVNPKLSNPSEQTIKYTEGCLSIPGVTAEVTRPEFVHLDAKLLSGRTISYRCGGLLARCLQHECDHLNGILFIELLSPELRKSLDSDLEGLRHAIKTEKIY